MGPQSSLRMWWKPIDPSPGKSMCVQGCRGVPWWHSGLRILNGLCGSPGHCCGLGSIPVPGTSTRCGCGQIKEKKRGFWIPQTPQGAVGRRGAQLYGVGGPQAEKLHSGCWEGPGSISQATLLPVTLFLPTFFLNRKLQVILCLPEEKMFLGKLNSKFQLELGYFTYLF